MLEALTRACAGNGAGNKGGIWNGGGANSPGAWVGHRGSCGHPTEAGPVAYDHPGSGGGGIDPVGDTTTTANGSDKEAREGSESNDGTSGRGRVEQGAQRAYGR